MTQKKTPRMATSDWVAMDRAHIWHPFTQAQVAPPPLPVARGEGAWLIDTEGRRYLDLISSWWVNLHGHAHPALVEAISKQAATLEQVLFAGFTHAPAARLAGALIARLPAGFSHVFYSDNGSTATEIALKMAWQYWRNHDDDAAARRRRRVLAFDGAYHGDTFGAMAAGRYSGFFDPFGDLLFEVHAMPFPATWQGDEHVEATEARALAAVDAWLAQHGEETAAMILEPLVQGAAGMRMCRPAFVQALVARLKAHGVLVIFDEVMTGFGRTGTFFACEQTGPLPDIVCLSKGISGGFLPLAATVVQPHIHAAFLDDDLARAFSHGHSYTANPLGCAAGLASLALFDAPDMAGRLAALASAQQAGLDMLAEHPAVVKPRRCGTVAAFNVSGGAGGYGDPVGPRLRDAFLAEGLVVRPLGDCVYVLPPYCVEGDELAMAWRQIERVVDQVCGRHRGPASGGASHGFHP